MNYRCIGVFVNNFVISLILPDVTLSFRNGTYHRIGRDRIDVIEVKSVEQLQLIFNDEFLISLRLIECEVLFNKITKGCELQKTTIVYLSKTGVTEALVTSCQKGLESKNIEVHTHKILGSEIVEGRFSNDKLFEIL